MIRVRLLFGRKAFSKNLYNGIFFTFGYTIFKSGLVWPLVDELKRFANEKESIPFPTVFAGCVGNVLPSILCNPFTVVKVRYMSDQKNTTLLQILKHIFLHENFSTFSKGIGYPPFTPSFTSYFHLPAFSFLVLTFNDTRSDDIEGWSVGDSLLPHL